MIEPILEQLFDSRARVQLLKIFLRNPEDAFTFSEIGERLQLPPRTYRRDLERLLEIELIKSKRVPIVQKRRYAVRKRKGRKKIVTYKFHNIRTTQEVYQLNKKFSFYEELKGLVLKSSPASMEAMLGRLKHLGRVKLALVAGIFLNNERKRVDLFIVGDDINERKLENFLRNLEAEVGKKVDFALMTTKEFDYRYDMYDRFLRDVLDYPHHVLINKMKIEV